MLTRPVITNFAYSYEFVFIQLDYGATYEDVREEKGYSRERHRGEKSCILRRANDVKYAVDQMEDYSLANCGEALAFLERLFSRAWNTNEEKLGRALIAVLSLHARIIEILFRAAGMEKEILTRVKSMVTRVCGQWQDSQGLKESIAAMDVTLKTIVADSIGCTTLATLASLDSDELRRRLLGVVGSTTSDYWEDHL